MEHRIALGLVEYPHAARYLTQRFRRLEGRVFEKRRFTLMGKRWYEYHRPRDLHLLLSANRLLSPTLAKEVRFSFDDEGFLADHACLFLLPTANTSNARNELSDALERVVNRELTAVELLQYCLAFLNSVFAKQTLERRRPTPKGSYQISEQFLTGIPVALPATPEEFEIILGIVGRLVKDPLPGERRVLETRIG